MGKKKTKKVKNRDVNVLKALKGEIDMRHKVVKSKKLYNRKKNHKKDDI